SSSANRRRCRATAIEKALANMNVSYRAFACAAVAVFAATAATAVVPTPAVIGPLASDPPGSASRNYPFFSTDMVLADFGYVEQEFFFDGTANRYDAPAPSGGVGNNAASASTANTVATGIPYRSRLLVRRPADASRSKG